MIDVKNSPRDWNEIEFGTEISEDLYEDLLNSLPPTTHFCFGFQLGETFRHDIDRKTKMWIPKYLTFISAKGKYYYAGINSYGEYPLMHFGI